MYRAVLIGGAVLAAFAVGLLAWSVLDDPVGAREAALEERLLTVDAADSVYVQSRPVDYGRLEKAILEKPALWQPLIRPPKQEAPPPNLQEMLKGVVLSRQRMGAGDSMRVKIRVPSAGGEASYWIRKGDEVNGLRVKEITDEYVKFSLMDRGKEYTALLVP